MRKINVSGFLLKKSSTCLNYDFTTAVIYFALMTKLDIFNG
jgi:hypothetical protein